MTTAARQAELDAAWERLRAFSEDGTTEAAEAVDNLIQVRIKEALDRLPVVNPVSRYEALEMAAKYADDQKLFTQPNANGYFDKGQTDPAEKSRILKELADYISGL